MRFRHFVGVRDDHAQKKDTIDPDQDVKDSMSIIVTTTYEWKSLIEREDHIM